jgi:hypothetical protein
MGDEMIAQAVQSPANRDTVCHRQGCIGVAREPPDKPRITDAQASPLQFQPPLPAPRAADQPGASAGSPEPQPPWLRRRRPGASAGSP